MKIPVYEHIFTVSINELDNYIANSKAIYNILKFDKINNVYIKVK